MADLVITASGVLAGINAQFLQGIAGETIVAGQPVYLDPEVNQLMLSGSAAGITKARAKGISLHGASLGQPLRIQTAGNITIGATILVGTTYVVSPTAGKIGPVADLISTDAVTILGVGGPTNTIKLDIQASNSVIP